MDLLKLTALDEDDLEVISAHLQDAVLRIGDISFLGGENRFALVANRFDWAAADAKADSFVRRRTGLHFNRVKAARSLKIRQSAPDAVLELLSIAFEADQPPSGRIRLIFSGGGEIVLEVECIEAAMSDLGPAWQTPSKPQHED
jgi:hypothetical protein